MYCQQFILCYCVIKAFFFVFAFVYVISQLRHSSMVQPLLRKLIQHSVSTDHVQKRRRAVKNRVSERLFSMRFPYYLTNWSPEKASAYISD